MSRAIAARRRAVAWVPATGGELLQGVDEQGPVLVSLPLRRGGTVTVRLLDGGLVSGVPERPRALAALGLALGHCGWTGGAEVLLGGEVPIGLGLGSSTIDVCGAIAATFAALRRPLPPTLLMRLATAVEPSDSSALPGLWAVDHCAARRLRPLGPAPRLQLVLVDGGGPLDTAEVHRRWGPGEPLPAGELQRLASALAHGDLGTIGAVATASARRNQHRFTNPLLESLLDAVHQEGAAGVCVAHSGCVAAALCPTPTVAGRVRERLSAQRIPTWREEVRAAGAAVHVEGIESVVVSGGLEPSTSRM